MSNDIVDDSKVVEDVYVSPEATSVIDPTVVESCTPILVKVHEFSEDTRNDVDVRVESSTPIAIDVHTRDNNTSDIEREPGVEYTVTTLNYSLSNQCFETSPDSSLSLTEFIALLPKHPIYPLFTFNPEYLLYCICLLHLITSLES